MKYGDDINFDEFFNRLGITEQQYISAVRFSLNRDIVLLKRAASEIRINNYKSVHLRVWQANMDIQSLN